MFADLTFLGGLNFYPRASWRTEEKLTDSLHEHVYYLWIINLRTKFQLCTITALSGMELTNWNWLTDLLTDWPIDWLIGIDRYGFEFCKRGP